MRTARLLTVSQHAPPGGVPARGDVPAWGVYLPEVYLPGGVPAMGGEPARGVYMSRGYLPRYPPLCEQNDRQVQKYYFSPNFVCGR